MTLDQVPVTAITGVGGETANRLGRLGIQSVQDLLHHYPRRYEDWTQIRPIARLRIGEEAVIHAELVWIKVERSPRRRIALAKALLRDSSGEMLAVWFGQSYLATSLKEGTHYYFRGSAGFDRSAGLKQLMNPAFEAEPRVLPIYPETAGLSSKQLRSIIQRALSRLEQTENLPAENVATYGLMSHHEAMQRIHTPPTVESILPARRRLAFEELFFFSLQMQLTKQELAQATAPVLQLGDDELRAFTAALPFQLTDAQRRAAWEIIQDLGRGQPMNRLVEGDVGSGKTVVAAFAAYVAAKAGYQTIWMAPTEILAAQHYQALTGLLGPFGVKVGIWTGSQKAAGQKDGDTVPEVVIGTQALLSGQLEFARLGLVIVDEQHRFGVDQRAQLKRYAEEITPHFLSMTATPIPRTLALALYGDLDVSIIDQRPADRKPIKTKVVAPANRVQSYEFLRKEIMAGRQAFVVCPLIEETENNGNSAPYSLFDDLEKKTAIAEYERLKGEIFPDLRIGLVHGRLKPKEKRAVMEQFARHDLDILVSTAVIEVGIDIPNATVMMIEGAERFGLAQLHQLRGRVGRGEHQSYCLLFTSGWSEKIATRLEEMELTDNGFKLAEADLRLRGPGDFIGTNQSGFPDFKMASLMDMELIEAARRAASQVITDKSLVGYCRDFLEARQSVSRQHHLE